VSLRRRLLRQKPWQQQLEKQANAKRLNGEEFALSIPNAACGVMPIRAPRWLGSAARQHGLGRDLEHVVDHGFILVVDVGPGERC